MASRRNVNFQCDVDDWNWLKDKPGGHTAAEHLRRALKQYIATYGMVIGPSTKITIDGVPIARVMAPPPTINFVPEEKPEIDPSTGEPRA